MELYDVIYADPPWRNAMYIKRFSIRSVIQYDKYL